MLHNISAATKNKPCSCSRHKECTGCAKKGEKLKDLKPHVYVEQPKRIPVPIIVTTHKDHPKKHVHITETIKNSFTAVREKYLRPTKTKSTVTQWYNKKKALKELKDQKKKEKKRLQDWEKWQRREKSLVRRAEADEIRHSDKERKDRSRWKRREAAYLSKADAEERKNLKKEKNKWEKQKKKERKRQRAIEKEEKENARREREEERKRQKALEKEDEDNARREREKEFYEQILEQQRYKADIAKHALKTRHPKSLKSFKIEPTTYQARGEYINYSDHDDYGYEPETPTKKPKTKKAKPPKMKKQKADKSLIVKPYSESRSVHVKQKRRKDTISRRFVNCFYRFCCEFYCWMTIILGVGLAIVLLL